MTTGINDTYTVKKLIGTRIKQARENLKYSRQQFADILNSQENLPIVKNKIDSVSPDRLKKWESGENPIALEWVPIICNVLNCDAGFIFGEYEEHNHKCADICKATGLSEKVVSDLIAYNDYAPHINGALSLLLENGLFGVIQEIYSYFDFYTAHENEKETHRLESDEIMKRVRKSDYAGALNLATSAKSPDNVLEAHAREIKALRFGLYESFIGTVDRIVKRQYKENRNAK